MRKIIVMCSVLVFLTTTVMATIPIMKAHKDAGEKGKRADGKAWSCALCHGEKAKPETWPEGVMTLKKAEVKGYKKGEAKHGELKNNALCKDCHK
jgi:cytochrome c553